MKRMISASTILFLGIFLTGCVTHSPVRNVHVVKPYPVDYYQTGYNRYSSYPSYNTYNTTKIYTSYSSKDAQYKHHKPTDKRNQTPDYVAKHSKPLNPKQDNHQSLKRTPPPKKVLAPKNTYGNTHTNTNNHTYGKNLSTQYEQKRQKTERVVRVVQKSQPIIANNTKPIKRTEKDVKQNSQRSTDNKRKNTENSENFRNDKRSHSGTEYR